MANLWIFNLIKGSKSCYTNTILTKLGRAMIINRFKSMELMH